MPPPQPSRRDADWVARVYVLAAETQIVVRANVAVLWRWHKICIRTIIIIVAIISSNIVSTTIKLIL